MTATSVKEKPRVIAPETLSTWLVVALTIVALVAGWFVKEGALNKSRQVENRGVVANIPAGWPLQSGLIKEEMVFSAADPLEPNHSYMVGLIPMAPGAPVTDIVMMRNLSRGQSLNLYRVIEQSAVNVLGRDSYKIVYAYIVPKNSGDLPVVIQGVDYYFANNDKALVVNMEESSDLFEAALPAFFDFLGSVSYTPGG